MREFNRLSRLFLTSGMLAASALGFSGCGNYALYDVHATTAQSSTVPAPNETKNSTRTDINQCRLTIVDEHGEDVETGLVLGYNLWTDPETSQTAMAGCKGGLTTPKLGEFSYSSSRTSGTLTFRIDGYADDSMTILQTGHSDPIAPTAYYPSVITVSFALAAPK